MGYLRPDGKYVGDDGKVYANYNDALAQHNSLKGRRATEAALARNARELEKTRSTQGVHQFFDNMFGGLGLDYDRGHATLAKQEAMLEAERRVLQNTLTDYQFSQGERSGLSPKEQRALIEGPDGAAARIARINAELEELKSRPQQNPPVAPIVSDDADARESALTAMRQQYAPGASAWDTDAGRALIQQAKNNRYKGDAAGLADFNTSQRKVGIGAIDEIVDAMGYAGTPMEQWARANENLALREYNKKFGGPAEYAGTGPSDEEIKAAMDAGNFFPSEGSPNPLGETGAARKSNTAKTESIQNSERQAINNESLNAIEALMDRSHKVPDLYGMDMFLKTAGQLYGGY